MLSQLKTRAPQLPIYGFNVMMRLAPTADGRNEAYRDQLSRWAELSVVAEMSKEVAALEREIPASALADYKSARSRNFAVNLENVRMVGRGVLDYLILSQDDARPRSVHVAERERLRGEAQKTSLTQKIAVQPGADEVSMLLVARALNMKFGRTPRVAVLYSSETIRTSVAPYEDRPLHRTISFHIAAAGAREVAAPAESDIAFFVYGSRAEAGAADKFVEAVGRAVDGGRRVIVADIDFKGDVQGGDPQFTENLRRRQVFPRLAGYAAWNTAGNTIGTALPHGIVFVGATARPEMTEDKSRARRIAQAQAKFMLHRLIDDYAYHSLVRPAANNFARSKFLNHHGSEANGQAAIETFIRERLRPHVDDLWKDFSASGAPQRLGEWSPFAVTELTDFRLHLPWGRTFEAEIDFTLR
ncbi:MAG: DUF4127 family protein [Pyrinomonadaceae bacterium]